MMLAVIRLPDSASVRLDSLATAVKKRVPRVGLARTVDKSATVERRSVIPCLGTVYVNLAILAPIVKTPALKGGMVRTVNTFATVIIGASATHEPGLASAPKAGSDRSVRRRRFQLVLEEEISLGR